MCFCHICLVAFFLASFFHDEPSKHNHEKLFIHSVLGKDRTLYRDQLNQAIALGKTGDPLAANAAFAELVKIAPHNAEINYGYGKTLLLIPRQTKITAERKRKKEEINQAIRHLALASKQDPKSARAHFYLAMAYYFANYNDLALSHFERAYKLDNTFVESWYNIGAIYDEKNIAIASKKYFDGYLRKKDAMDGGFDDFDPFR